MGRMAFQATERIPLAGNRRRHGSNSVGNGQSDSAGFARPGLTFARSMLSRLQAMIGNGADRRHGRAMIGRGDHGQCPVSKK